MAPPVIDRVVDYPYPHPTRCGRVGLAQVRQPRPIGQILDMNRLGCGAVGATPQQVRPGQEGAQRRSRGLSGGSGQVRVTCQDDPDPERSVREATDLLTGMPSDGRGELDQVVSHPFGSHRCVGWSA
ncbi:hypothetical protein GCM10023160_08170 [Brachybacterium paraconglomeratum]